MKKIIKKIKKFITNILVMPIRNREKRHYTRWWIMNFRFLDCLLWIKFVYSTIRQNSVLLIETNNCHGEVIAGYIRYFQKLGFNIDISVSSDVYAEKPFCRLNMENVRIFPCDFIVQKWILYSKKIINYKHVFLMSSAYYRRSVEEKYTSALDAFPPLRGHPSLFVIEHDLADIARFKEEEFLKHNRLITLGHFDKGVFMSPILFGNIEKNPKNKVTTFITIGAIKGFRKNHQALIQAIEQLAQENLRFKVIIVGSGSLDSLPKTVHPYIQIMGRLNFPKMFKCMEKADFFLPLLDADTPEHERYITTGVTGSAQLIYAFSKVPVLHPKFAPFYEFNEKNAILTSDLAQGMRKAIQISADEYTQKQSALTDLAEKLENESLHNLKEILK